LDFFQHQELARRNTRVLVLLYALAVIAVAAAVTAVMAGIFLYARAAEQPGPVSFAAVPPALLWGSALGTLAVILLVTLVQSAQNSKAPAQRQADRAAHYLVLVAVLGGRATFALWFCLVGQTALFALTLAITVVVITCPDALGLATPTAVMQPTTLNIRHESLAARCLAAACCRVSTSGPALT